jgi:hypothetical protein
MKIRLYSLSILVLLCFQLNAQLADNVVIPRPPLATYPYSQVEPSIAIHPKNQNIIVAGTVMNDFYYSKDGGKSWVSESISSPYGVNGDPVLAFDTKGRMYYFHLSNYKATYRLDRIVCQSSRKVGKKMTDGSFPKPVDPKVQDKHWIAIDPSSNHIYMTWTQFDAYDSDKIEDSSLIVFSKSTDQGKTWTDPVCISSFPGDCLDSDNTVEGAVPAVGPQGELYVTWTGPKGLVFQKSLDGGVTWLKEEQFISEQIEGWDLTVPGVNRTNGLPILLCDHSEGPNRGNLYLNWCDQRNGTTDTDSWLMVSKDGGDSWGEPIRVNQDTTSSHQFLTWMTIDQSTGNLYTVYYDRRNYTDNQTDVYLSASNDGGLTFIDFKLSESPFIPDSTVFFGDYLNVSAVNGMISAIWPRMDNKKISLIVSTFNEASVFGK